jgi:cytochrome c oxidase subunit II
MGIKPFGVGFLALVTAGCERLPKSLDSAGRGAEMIADLFWFFTAVSVIVWIGVVAALITALFRRRGRASERYAEETDRAAHEGAARVVVTAVGATVVTLLALTAASYFTDRGLANLTGNKALTIDVSARQWWWEAEYESNDPSQRITTANELHIPIGTPVNLKLSSADVIHSFWVPELTGKQDLVPGRHNVLRLVATRPGVYRGQCAEYCGLQHAHMAIIVVAETAKDFEAWRERQLAPAADPGNDEARRGREVFLQKPCVMCHKISGTPAGSRAGPDLTHVASRRGLAANTLPFTRGSLAAWIADPQSVKPGSKMPLTQLTADELNAVVAYLEGLQ